MKDKLLPSDAPKDFEALKLTNEHGAEYWSARDLQHLLGYSQWRRFEDAIKRAIISSESSGNDPDYHFAGAGKPIVGGKGAVQLAADYHLSRFACYLTCAKQVYHAVRGQNASAVINRRLHKIQDNLISEKITGNFSQTEQLKSLSEINGVRLH